MKFKILLILALVFSHLLSAQNRSGGLSNNVFNNNLDFFAIQKVDNVYNNGKISDVQGSPYLWNGWKVVSVKISSGNNPSYQVPARYNVLANRFEIQVNGEAYMLDPNAILSIHAGTRTFKPGPTVAYTYHEELAAGASISLFKIHSATLLESPGKTLGLIERKIVLKEKEMLQLNDGSVVKLPRRKKKLMKLLDVPPAKKEAFKDLNVKDPEDLSRIIESI
ncbi:MAG: hypothetical protein HKN61_08195 [Flavobacteriaceae bacterium]|nr:hypothetical protein [Flavobacteriaceae bacterium]